MVDSFFVLHLIVVVGLLVTVAFLSLVFFALFVVVLVAFLCVLVVAVHGHHVAVVSVFVGVEVVVAEVPADVLPAVDFVEVVVVGVHGGVLALLKFLVVLLKGVAVLGLKFALLSLPLGQLGLFHVFASGVLDVLDVERDFVVGAQHEDGEVDGLLLGVEGVLVLLQKLVLHADVVLGDDQHT